MSTEAQTKKFQKGERVIPAATDKALKYYPAEDEQVNKKVREHRRRIDQKTPNGMVSINGD